MGVGCFLVMIEPGQFSEEAGEAVVMAWFEVVMA